MFFVHISIHAPTRGATHDLSLRSLHLENFNPRAHEGRDSIARSRAWRVLISIHAPTRGATSATKWALCAARNFNPRAHEGRDLSARINTLPIHYFNPRAHEGRDLLMQSRWRRPSTISIHAPTRGATCPHSHSAIGRRFQSTRPRGARPAGSGVGSAGYDFNPRAHEGRDCWPERIKTVAKIFQSTRPRGARRQRRSRQCVSISFQSTRPRGARLLFC